MADSGVPIIDFAAYSLDDAVDPSNEGLQELTARVHQALTTIGFFHLKNFGIPAETIERAFRESRNFFTLGDGKKKTYKSGELIEGTFHGWVTTDMEGLDPRDIKKDFKESFNFMANIKETPDNQFPDVPEVPGLKPALLELFGYCTLLHNKVLKVMARALQLENPMALVDTCRRIGQPDNTTALRTLYYPPIPAGTDTEKLSRCGEHTDYGTVTLLFQDDRGGLEVKDVSGRWLPITPIPDTVLVNIGDLMQRLTADVYTAAVHRVVLSTDAIREARQAMAFFGNPDDNVTIECLDGSNKYPPEHRVVLSADASRVTRQSIAFFGNPDDGVMVECVDGSNKYPPVNAIDYIHGRARESHQKYG